MHFLLISGCSYDDDCRTDFCCKLFVKIESNYNYNHTMSLFVYNLKVCWLPQNVYFILTSYFPQVTNSDYIQEVYLGIYWLAMSNSMYNPIIYCWMNSR